MLFSSGSTPRLSVPSLCGSGGVSGPSLSVHAPGLVPGTKPHSDRLVRVHRFVRRIALPRVRLYMCRETRLKLHATSGALRTLHACATTTYPLLCIALFRRCNCLCSVGPGRHGGRKICFFFPFLKDSRPLLQCGSAPLLFLSPSVAVSATRS